MKKEQLLTKRESEVMELLLKGYSNPRISKELLISKHTTKAHISSIYEKLNVSNRVEAIIKYIKVANNIEVIIN